MQFVRKGTGFPPLVFVHGFGCSLEVWDQQVADLRAVTTTVAVDLRGHGRTPGTVADCNIETFATDVVGLIAELDLGPAILVGHSMGCRVVLEVSRRSPELLVGAVLVEGSRLAEGGSGAEYELADQIAEIGYGAFVRRFVGGGFVDTSDPKLVERTIGRALELSADVGTGLILDVVRWDEMRFDEAIGGVEAPLLAVQSTRLDADRKHVSLRPGEATPYLDCLKAHVSDCAVSIIAGVGHFSQLEAPDLVTSSIRVFVGRLRAAAEGASGCSR